MANFDPKYIEDDFDKSEKPESKSNNIKSSDPSGHSKLPDLGDIQKLFNSTSGTARPVSDDKQSSVEAQEEDDNSSKVGREIILDLEQVLCDHSKNLSRGGKIFTVDDPEIVELAATMKHGLINVPEVRLLVEPVPNENGLKHHFYTHEVVSGYKRFVGLQRLKIKTSRFTTFDDIDDDTAILHNAIENWGRKDPTDYDLAVSLSLLAKRKNWDAEKLAKNIGGKRPRVESLLIIIERCPKELLEIFRATPTIEVRRQLSRIARIHRPTQDEAHQAMIEEWNRYVASLEKPTNTNSNDQPTNNPSRNPRGNTTNTSRAYFLRQEQQTANEWFDPITKVYKKISDEQREYGDMLLQYLCAPNKGRSPFR